MTGPATTMRAKIGGCGPGWRGRFAVMLTGLCLTAFIAGVQPASAQERPINVVVTTKPVHSLVAQVTEGVTTPHLLVEGAASSHTFTLKPSAMRAILAGGLFVRVSATTEPFTRKLTEDLPKDVAVLTLAEERYGVQLLPKRSSGAFERHSDTGDAEGHSGGHDRPEHHDHDEEDAATNIDGHIWLDPENAKAIVAAVRDSLSVKWPAHAKLFDANAAKAIAQLAALEDEVRRDLEPLKGKPFVVFHDAYQYFETRFGLTAVGAITLSPDQPPSAQRLTQVREKIRELNVACIFAEPGFQPKLLAAITEGSASRTGTLDPEGQSLDSGPGLYAVLLRRLAHDLQECLKGR